LPHRYGCRRKHVDILSKKAESVHPILQITLWLLCLSPQAGALEDMEDQEGRAKGGYLVAHCNHGKEAWVASFLSEDEWLLYSAEDKGC
jgi:hypothetical protein